MNIVKRTDFKAINESHTSWFNNRYTLPQYIYALSNVKQKMIDDDFDRLYVIYWYPELNVNPPKEWVNNGNSDKVKQEKASIVSHEFDNACKIIKDLLDTRFSEGKHYVFINSVKNCDEFMSICKKFHDKIIIFKRIDDADAVFTKDVLKFLKENKTFDGCIFILTDKRRDRMFGKYGMDKRFEPDANWCDIRQFKEEFKNN